jgi:hypothetical protein
MKQAWRAPFAARPLGYGTDDLGDDPPGDGNALRHSRVVKKLLPDQPGALKLARRYGDALVCVRYRHDATHTQRYTTVELVVDQAPLQRRRHASDEIVHVWIAFGEGRLQQEARASGAQWERASKLWRMPHSLARRLNLTKRITKT